MLPRRLPTVSGFEFQSLHRVDAAMADASTQVQGAG